MSPKHRWVSAKLLKWARKRIGMSPEDVEQASCKLKKKGFSVVKADDVRAWEEGKKTPDYEHLETLTEIYVCPISWFFMDSPPEEGDITKRLSCRGLHKDWTELSWETRQTLAWFVEMAEWICELIEEHNINWQVDLPLYTDKSNPDEVAQKERRRLGFTANVRKQWREPADAFFWWRRKIETTGVFCLQKRLKAQELRGAVYWSKAGERTFPFILVNSEDVEAAQGRVFTLLHEYGHLILTDEQQGIVCDFRGTTEEGNPEPVVNLFAARMLLTPEELKQQLLKLDLLTFQEDWSDRSLDKIRAPFAVSRDVIAIMLEEMRLAPRGFYKRKREQWSNRRPFGRGKGGGKRLVERKLNEIGFSCAKLLVQLVRKETVSPIVLSDALEMRVSRTHEFLDYARSVLQDVGTAS